MEIRQLRYFLAVAERQNFTRAAEMVHVSQPSLSVQIAALEEELGTPLFDRLGRHVVLTQAGKLLHEHAERIARELEQAVQAVRELSGAERGQLLVGTLSTVNSYLIPLLVCRFRQRFPNIHLQVQARPSAEIVEALLANRFDVGLCLLPVSSERVTTIPLFDETLSLVAPVGAHLPRRRMRMRDLAELPLVLMPADYCLRKMIETECAKAGVCPRVSVEMTSPEGILEAVKHGAGVTILPELYARHRLGTGSLRMIELYDPVPRHSVGLAYLSRKYQGVAASEFLRLCRTTLSELVQSEDLTAKRPQARAAG